MRRLLLTLISVLLVLPACAPAPTAPAGADEVPPERVAEGGSLRWSLSEFPSTFNRLSVHANLGIHELAPALLPTVWRHGADGAAEPNPDYLTSARLTATEPRQEVVYRINPKATWNDGSPITWEDFHAQWRAMVDPRFEVNSSEGYTELASVERGGDDREVRVVFRNRFADWKSLFSPLLPRSLTRDPVVFNDGWRERPGTTAGPFRFVEADPGQKVVVLARDERWWGERPKLDRLVYRVIPSEQATEALAAGELDVANLAPDLVSMRQAQAVNGVRVTVGPTRTSRHLDVNGRPGALLADPDLRRAVVQGLDRGSVLRAHYAEQVPHARLLNSLILLPGARHYADSPAAIAHDPDAANRKLDELGWRREGAVRRKDGRELALRYVIPIGGGAAELEARLAADQLARIGVRVEILPVAVDRMMEDYIGAGRFDLSSTSWIGSPFPVSEKRRFFTKLPWKHDSAEGEGDPVIRDLFARATEELDERRQAELIHQLDHRMWTIAYKIPLLQRPGIVAARAGVANVHAFGYAHPIPYSRLGFRR
ncbi:ABC transporter family substrate-binding protein [Allokutzneria sp. A3M-2-11 16]|uniref:ABC transporter family substrate-binding protein n=1 Tax=Allokutzneria sp. A3M-2-11 16 TaxID=2962043 RepID=UPI0020B8862A|nr:ABC transporter family substrate-binding protein [Allokutzneria sp. A3M-2-11 16]MCP3803438.1 ABC transporter family substrate-binding protein [Allokutzneria sp. A3M-2-11 16]